LCLSQRYFPASYFDPFGSDRKIWQIKPETSLRTPDARLHSRGKILFCKRLSQD
jgi:hypothetical protein